MTLSTRRQEAISGSPDDKYRYLESLIFQHPTLERINEAVDRAMTPSSGIVLVIGPTGAGKSTFARAYLHKLLKVYETEIQENPGIIPAALMTLHPHDTAKEFNFVLFYQRACDALKTPCLQADADTPTLGFDKERSSRCIFERALQHRRVRHLIIDEAIHFTQSNTDPKMYGNLLKGLADRAGMNVLLIGAYGSELLAECTDQLAVRVIVEHFPRYHDTRADRVAFTNVMKTYAAYFPFNETPNLRQHVPELMAASFGLVGYACRILKRAVRMSARIDNKWNDDCLRDAMPSLKAQHKVARRTTEGEDAIQDYLAPRKPVNYKTEADIRAEFEKEAAERKRSPIS